MPEQRNVPETVDIVIVGAGLSGVGAAYYLTKAFPDKKIAILEGRGRIGGTWDLFRYPGIRSDSQLHTYGYEFKPWTREEAIADGRHIREYIEEAAGENGIDDLIRFHHHVQSADWSSDKSQWTLTVKVTAPGADEATIQINTNWVYGATGYFRYDEAYTPDFEGRDEFEGDILHPQFWPEDYDYAGKKVVIIGSGATAITMVPAMATGPSSAQHVTMLQRTPSYIATAPRIDKTALAFTRWFGVKRGYALTRQVDMWIDWLFVRGVSKFPRIGAAVIRGMNRKALPKGYDIATHFTPPYKVWDQRVCLAPDGDLFQAISDGKASVETDQIVRFTRTGILLASGRELEADLIVTATGLNVRLFGGIPQTVDGRAVDLSDTLSYRGMLLSGIPNWSVALGYTKVSSWTLKVGLTARYVTKLIKHMDAHGYDKVVAVADPDMETRPLLDLTSGYALRAKHQLPRQGTSLPWRTLDSYQADRKLLAGPLVDRDLHFSARPVNAGPAGKGARGNGAVTAARKA
ncbi:flavin-containing monooxygenase [Saccharopolyspora tripterygii]